MQAATRDEGHLSSAVSVFDDFGEVVDEASPQQPPRWPISSPADASAHPGPSHARMSVCEVLGTHCFDAMTSSNQPGVVVFVEHRRLLFSRRIAVYVDQDLADLGAQLPDLANQKGVDRRCGRERALALREWSRLSASLAVG